MGERRTGILSGLASALLFGLGAPVSKLLLPLAGSLLGVLAIALACLCWAIDNNFNARLSMKDPVQLLRIKMLCAGALNLAAAAIFGQRVQGMQVAAGALLLGSLSYGLSFLLYTRSQPVPCSVAQ